jgi:hypothetical protein
LGARPVGALPAIVGFEGHRSPALGTVAGSNFLPMTISQVAARRRTTG